MLQLAILNINSNAVEYLPTQNRENDNNPTLYCHNIAQILILGHSLKHGILHMI